LNKVVIVLAHKKYSHHFITLRLNHCILTMLLILFWTLNVVISLLSMEDKKKPLRFPQNILICVLKMNKGLMGVERHEGE